jgi:hypothetical protein
LAFGASTAAVVRPLPIRYQEVVEHREVAGVAGDEARAVDLHRRRDQGVRDQDAVALPVATAIGAADPGDFQVDAVNHELAKQAVDPALLGCRSRAGEELGGRDGGNGRRALA